MEAFVQPPVTVQVSEPNVIADEADEMLTFPAILESPDVLVMSPPLIVSPSVAAWLLVTVRTRVFFASVPPEIVRIRSTTTAEPSVLVPPDTVTVVNVLSVARSVVVPVLSKV